jgi:stage II sporulation protein D
MTQGAAFGLRILDLSFMHPPFPRFFAVLGLLLGLALAQAPVQDLVLRVLLEEAKEATVGVNAHLRLSGYGEQNQPAASVKLGVSGAEVLVNGQPSGPWVEFQPTDGLFTLEGKPYRGSLQAVAQSGRLLLINRVWLEDYLLGVVPGEVPRSFPAEVLRAQAILARTFALYRLNPKALYDLCDDERCQVYLGYRAETPEHSAAVQATRGLIVSYGQQPITAVYHADSGGYTAASAEVWGGSVPYLIARPDPYSQSPKGVWGFSLSPQAVDRQLVAQGVPVGEVQGLEIVQYSESGRVARLRVRGSLKSTDLIGPQATRFLRGLGLPSTRITLNPVYGSAVPQGTVRPVYGSAVPQGTVRPVYGSAVPQGIVRGWDVTGFGVGHGVGMSQWGARGFALQGWDFKQILGYYYPGTFLSSFEVVEGLRQKLLASGYQGVQSAAPFELPLSSLPSALR